MKTPILDIWNEDLSFRRRLLGRKFETGEFKYTYIRHGELGIRGCQKFLIAIPWLENIWYLYCPRCNKTYLLDDLKKYDYLLKRFIDDQKAIQKFRKLTANEIERQIELWLEQNIANTELEDELRNKYRNALFYYLKDNAGARLKKLYSQDKYEYTLIPCQRCDNEYRVMISIAGDCLFIYCPNPKCQDWAYLGRKNQENEKGIHQFNDESKQKLALVIKDQKFLQALEKVKENPDKIRHLLDIYFEESIRLELEQAKKENSEQFKCENCRTELEKSFFADTDKKTNTEDTDNYYYLCKDCGEILNEEDLENKRCAYCYSKSNIILLCPDCVDDFQKNLKQKEQDVAA